MSVQAVNSVNNIQQKPVQSTIEPKKSEQKESIANGTTLLLGSLAALAIGAGIYFATKGRGGKSVTGGTSSVTDEQKPLEILKEYTLDAFKNAGHKIEKGKAITSDGKNYTGTIFITAKNGNKYTKTYENGMLSEILHDNETIYRSFIKNDEQYIETSKNKIIKDISSGKIIFKEVKGKERLHYSYDNNGDLLYLKKQTYNGFEITKYNNGKPIMTVNCTNGNNAKFYNENGEIVDEVIYFDLSHIRDRWEYHNLDFEDSYDMISSYQKYWLLNDKQYEEWFIMERNGKNLPFPPKSIHIPIDDKYEHYGKFYFDNEQKIIPDKGHKGEKISKECAQKKLDEALKLIEDLEPKAKSRIEEIATAIKEAPERFWYH